MILISYPSGGFGNFLFHVLTEFADNTYKPDNSNFEFDLVGRSHQTIKYTKIYFHDRDYTLLLPDTDKECLILCDNGINNDSYAKINTVFHGATIIRTVIDNSVRPIIYKTCVVKAQNSDTIKETKKQVNTNWIDSAKDYSIRENFTLFYHNWPFGWGPMDGCINISIEQLINSPVDTVVKLINAIKGNVLDLDLKSLTELCNNWIVSNQSYFKIYYDWQRINIALDQNRSIDLNNITDLHDQGYINYCLEKKFNYTIPVYDYRNWFQNTLEIPKHL